LADRAALVTGGSSGIGLAIAHALGEDGYKLTVSSRRPSKLEAAGEKLREAGHDVEIVPAQMADEEDVVNLVNAHGDKWGRMDVLVNSAGIGVGQPMDAIKTKHLDLQLDVNLRAIVIATRESLPMLREAGAEHGKALIVNLASIAGKSGQGWLSVYAATKAAVINFSQGTQKELGDAGIQVTALAPAFVDTPMTDFVKQHVEAEKMIRPEDIAEAVRMLLRTSPNCLVPEIVFSRPGDSEGP
jgi:NAD(P)-dependent dehydrogenase (short-subunit alcohol dehydrogenase family)